MATLLLTTKLHVPRARLDLVPRPHLIERLSDALTRPLTLVSAPAGFGKTTLLGEWIVRREPRVAWVSLDEQDNDTTCFWTYIIAALQRLDPGLGENALAMLHARGLSPQPLSTSFEPRGEAEWAEAALIVLLNEIEAAPNARVLVLDDYHLITAPAIHQTIAFLLDHLPASMHLVLISRADPPLPLARLRARGQLAEIRTDDLRFTPDEAATFLNRIMDLKLSADQVAALESRTEGWIAGLQMAALSMRGRADIDSFVSAFAGSHRYILDYLAEEVLNRQPEAVQTFLLLTCLLDRLNAPLCDAVLAQESGYSQTMLEYLERANLFITSLDDERRWYRYHPLFAEVLRHRLAQTQPGRAPDLHRRAGEWHAENGFTAEAIRHALAAGEVERAANLIEQSAITLLGLVEEATLQAWLDALPADVVRAHPSLGIAYAWVLGLKGELGALEARLDEIEARLAGANDAALADATRDDLLGQVAALRAQVAFGRQDLPGAIALCRQALARLAEDRILTRAVVVFHLGLAERVQGDPAAERDLRQAGMLARSAGNLVFELLVLDNLAALQEVQGKLHEAERTYRQMLQLGARRDGQRLTIAGIAHIGLGKLRREWNELDTAQRELDEGIALSQLGGIGQEIEFDGLITLALISQAQGHAIGADEMLRKAMHIAQQRNRPDWVMRVATFAARLALARGNVAEAARWAQTYGIRADGGLTEWLEIEHTTLARLLIAQGKPAEALSLLGRLLEVAEAAGRMGRVIEILALQALAFTAQGDRTSATKALDRALALAEPEGYSRLFADEGEPMAALLRQAAARGVAVEYVAKLLGALAPSPSSPPPRVPPLIEPLSERELQVLRLVAAGLTNQQIADELVVVVATVKAHINRIYRKLDVTNRVQAVARARELNLL
jgi:LuxR family maltose regulon positive regulatory protein